nr:DUF5711 family protein [Feifania hominis]
MFLFANREVLNLYTLRSFLNSIGITWFGESQVSSFELELDLSQTNLFDCYRDSLVVLSNSGLELTRLTGAPQYSETFHYSNPVLQVRDSKILTYDRGAKSLKTANGFGLDFELTTEYPILSAKMDDKGSFAILTTSKNYKAQAMVYNSSNEAVYRWNSASSYISDISLDEDSHRLAIAGFNTGAAELSTTVTIIDYRSGEIVAAGEPIDGLVAALDYNADGGLFAVTDDALYVLGPDGAQRGVYHFGDSTLSAASAELENGALLILSHHVAGTSLSMVGVDTFGKVMFEIALDSYVEDLAVSDKAILLLVNNRALLYNSSGELQNTISVSDDVRKVAVTSRQQALILELNEVTVVQ